MPSDPASTTRIPPPTARLLYRLHRGWAPPYIPQRTVTELRWQGAKLDLFIKSVLLDHDELHVDCELPGQGEETIATLLGELNKHPIEGRCDDGYTFSASDGVAVSEDVSEDLSSIKTRLLISCRTWELRAPRPAAKLWVGTVETPLIRGNSHGNMALSLRGVGESHHYRLAGQRDVYYLMRAEGSRHLDRWRIAVEPEGAARPAHDLVHEDLTNIARSFGCPMYVSTLYGLDEGGAPVAVMGSGFGWRGSARPRAVDPAPREEVAHFFDAGAAGMYFADIPEADAQAVIPELWPRFIVHRSPLPQHGPIALIAIFAAGLRSKTGGLVTASVLPRARPSTEPARFDFVLESSIGSRLQTVLFSIEEGPGGEILVEDSSGSEAALRTDAEVESYLRELATADETRETIERLMLVGG